MAIRSMTGFGRAAVALGGVRHTIEIRAVNHRFLDLKIRLPRAMSAAEGLVRQRISGHVHRGRVEVNITSVGGESGIATQVEINWPLAEAVREAHAALASTLGVPDRCDSAQVAGWPGVLLPVVDSVDSNALDGLGGGLDAAVAQLVAMRTEEGAALEAALRRHLDVIEVHRSALAIGAPAQAVAWRARFEQRLRDTLSAVGREVDEGRVLHEVAVFAEKTDIAEELARLGSHLEQARGIVDASDGQAIGRRLDFICQEMLRETNTVGSKVGAVELTRTVVEIKAELERLREQVQNVE